MLRIGFFGPNGLKEVTQNKFLFKRAVLTALKRKKHLNAELNLIFTNAREIKKINKRFLNKNSATDVIAFNYHPKKTLRRHGMSALDTKPFGDIYICVDRAGEQARERGHSLFKELLILAVHGSLHLAGMDDKNPAQRKKMELKTQKILDSLLFENHPSFLIE